MFTPFLPAIRTRLLALVAPLFWLPVAVSGSVLMLDFGPTVATGANQTNSPYHSLNKAFKGRYWNTVGLSNISSGLVYSDGSVANGVTLTLGASIRSTELDFSRAPSNANELGTTINTGVFAGTSVGRDGIFTTSVPAGNNLVGIKVGGLKAGRYEVYVVGANTNNGINHQSPAHYFVAATGDVSTFETDGLSPSETTLLTPMAREGWFEGESYTKIAVDITEGQFLVLAVGGVGVESRGFLNAVQIAPAPASRK